MADQFSEVTRVGFGGRIINSLKGIVIGIILFLASFVVLYYNEGRVDYSTLAKKAVEVNATQVDTTAEGKFVAATGAITSPENLSDGLYIKPGDYIALTRKVETYAWVEHTKTEKKKEFGGSETDTTTYTYTQEWTDHPVASSKFIHPEGHTNIISSAITKTYRVGKAKVGAYSVNIITVELPAFTPLALSSANVAPAHGAIIANDTYLFVPENGKSNLNNPVIGDVRVSYFSVPTNSQVTVLGEQQSSSISPYMDEAGNSMYRMFLGSKNDAIRILHSEYTMMTWLLRILGFVLMFAGLSMVLGPISVLLDIIPAFGSVSRFVIGLAAFVVSLVLSVVTILVSMVAHNLIALTIALLVAAVVLIFIFKRAAGPKPAVTPYR
jgi:hypothetical protein